MLTADTLTDAAICDAHDRAVARFERGVDDEADREIVHLAKLAMFPHMLMSMLDDEDHFAVRAARARCAEILNARAKEQR